jgi:hypothetical protein
MHRPWYISLIVSICFLAITIYMVISKLPTDAAIDGFVSGYWFNDALDKFLRRND